MLSVISDDKVSQWSSQRILMRVDYNCPMSDGRVTDATRIDRTLAGIKRLTDAGASVILMSHFGRPKGVRQAEMSLAPVRAYLSDILGYDVPMADDICGTGAAEMASALAPGKVMLLENLRFHAGEEANDPDFAASLAALGDIFVGNAFSCAHRAHASTEGVAHLLPAFAGDTLAAEVHALHTVLETPKRPVAAVVGGAKISTKLAVLEHLIERVDHLILGGGMANTFLAAGGADMGLSLQEADMYDTARKIMTAATAKGCQLHLPVDGVVAETFVEGADNKVVGNDTIGSSEMVLDIGPDSIARACAVLDQCETVLWNGPMGAFEVQPFDKATVQLARHAAMLTAQNKLISVAGGGDTVAALNHAGAAGQFSYVSLAGGAFLEWIEGKRLPGIAVLSITP
ncbi:MAG: phosphoglycerate kinase [Alphaproteobacteria bacterium]|nr:phosphoglycerate kinase [Alphaproteobacteria bacterium]